MRPSAYRPAVGNRVSGARADRVAPIGFHGSHLWQLRQHVGDALLITPAAVVVVVDDAGRVLLIERTDMPAWCLPGGSAEPLQSAAACAAEELAEEAGVTASAEDLVGFAILSDPRWTRFTFPNGDEIHSHNLCFAARRWTGEPRADGDESAAVGWFALEALPEPLLPASARALELYACWRATGTFQVS